MEEGRGVRAYWAVHIRSSPVDGDNTARVIASAVEFLKENALPWIEVMSLKNDWRESFTVLMILLTGLVWYVNAVVTNAGSRFTLKQAVMPTSDPDSLARDRLWFTMHFFHPIHQSAQHIYHSALALSPKSLVFSSQRKHESLDYSSALTIGYLFCEPSQALPETSLV